MKHQTLNANMSIVTLNNGNQVGFSYAVPVVAVIDGRAYRTEEKYSVTTSKHCGKLLQSMHYAEFAGTKPQSFFDSLGG